MNKEIPVKVDVTPHSYFGERYSDAVIYMHDNGLRLRFVRTGNVLKHIYNDEDGCPVFGWYDVEFPFYAIHYPDGQEDWTTQSIFDELDGIPVEPEVEKEPVELTFTFVTEEKVGDISVTEAIQVTQVIR